MATSKVSPVKMAPTLLEGAVENMARVVTAYMTVNGNIKITEQGLQQLVNNECKHIEQPQEENCPGVYKLRTDLTRTLPGTGIGRAKAMESDMYVKDNKLVIESRFK